MLSLLLHGLGMRLDKVAVELGGLFFVPIASTCIAEDSLQCCVNEKNQWTTSPVVARLHVDAISERLEVAVRWLASSSCSSGFRTSQSHLRLLSVPQSIFCTVRLKLLLTCMYEDWIVESPLLS